MYDTHKEAYTVPNLNALRSFVAVIDTGSVAAAARTCGYSAAAVSRQLASLRDRYGVVLFRPSGRSITPTPKALELAVWARMLVAEADRFERYSRQFASTTSAALTHVPTSNSTG
jgi:DNA-binding transcriptional LysR family regulator